MNIQEIINLVDGESICLSGDSDFEVKRAFASDLMSDVLTLNTEGLLLITGLANMQTIRTAEMAEIKNILFVRNKKPGKEMIELAREEGMNLFLCKKSMFSTCGILHQAGLNPVY
ncbi:MAG: hypothetical protein JXA77_10890 [Bacteroidales bacterium]|nr:hypothetical protein [Bacteroidales bacterium]MBN2818998.1 hypothetical protein [Bacteroidales bacterium]